MIKTLALKNITNARELERLAALKEYQDILSKLNEMKAPDSRSSFAVAMFKSRIGIDRGNLLSVMDTLSVGLKESIDVSMQKLSREQLGSVWDEVGDPDLLFKFTRQLVDNDKGREGLLNSKKQTIITKMPVLLSPSLNDTANVDEWSAIISALCLSVKISSFEELRANGLDGGYIDRARRIFAAGAKVLKRKPSNDFFFGDRANQVGIGFPVVAYTLFTEGGQDNINTWMDAVKVAGVAKANLLPIDANSVDVLKKFGQTNFGSTWLVEIATRMSQRGSPDLIYAVKPLTYSNAGRGALRKLPQKTTNHLLKQIADTKSNIPGRGKTLFALALNAGIDNPNVLYEKLPKSEADAIKKAFEMLRFEPGENKYTADLFFSQESKDAKAMKWAKFTKSDEITKEVHLPREKGKQAIFEETPVKPGKRLETGMESKMTSKTKSKSHEVGREKQDRPMDKIEINSPSISREIKSRQ